MASYNTGYEDELFQYPVGPSLHCCICTNVIKDAAMCHNEHIFCRACITRHLMNFETCPTCMEPLTVETLTEATRGIRNLLSELKIRCEFFDRGCDQFIELGDLERHVANCGFAPAVCSNEGCELEVNQRDLFHHETAVCELRRIDCHSCNKMRQKMDTMKVNLAAMNEKLDRNRETIKAVVENMAVKVELVQEQLNKQEESNLRLEASLNEITKQLERLTQQSSHEVQAEYAKKGIAEAGGMERESNVVITGGRNEDGVVNSVEMFSLATGKWTSLQQTRERRLGASSVVHNNQILVSGGYAGTSSSKSIEKLSLNAVQPDKSIPWEIVPSELPERLLGHCSVVYNGRLIVIGGYDGEKSVYSNSITEISLVAPYTSKLLAIMPQKRCYHGVAIFGDKIMIVGGGDPTLRSVVMYDITNNECQELAPLPYPVREMATVKWDDNNLMIMGGTDRRHKPLNKVIMYNIKTQKSRMLPDMKYKRGGCVAAVIRDTVIVMGGSNERNNNLKSVECFRFDSYTWKELPEMNEGRRWATAVVC